MIGSRIVNSWGTIVASERFATRSKGQYYLAIGLYWGWLITVVGFSCNYLDIQEKFKIDKLKGVKKVLAIIGMDIILILIVLMIGVFLVNKV